MNDKKFRYVFLSVVPGLGPVSLNRLMQLCGSLEACFDIDTERLLEKDREVGGKHRIGEKKLGLFLAHRNDRSIADKAWQILDQCDQKGIMVITPDDARFPLRFRNLPDMPFVLYTRGGLRINEFSRSIGMVGARRCSGEGKREVIEATKRELAKGAAIISGMAKGIDSYAHTAALLNGGYTIAVLGNGPDVCYPKEHERLYERIAERGCILSEYPPGIQPRQYMFPQRNRLIAALCDELYVYDTGRNSGTHSTIDGCLRYGRKVVYQGIADPHKSDDKQKRIC